MSSVPITEALAIDTESEMWVCRKCGAPLNSAHENYKKGCLVSERDPTQVHNPEVDTEYNFAPDPTWTRIIEFYCPDCGLMIENEYLPPGHPITYDIDIELDNLNS